ncbi:unnamed protein product [Acanthoscelides obtectus]|uniref:Uncharacterized protein n=1 Tax=Acanthoscelides obtectus TaxID=200917 RepID=A0A9P0PJI8_ACAOB|nr:unnamed protein product [Acanthoscelides obtectus]CAK1669182.1 hypothetical protein AOBTE_LOCUS26856 [Acanthoscelides obtectus]
MPKKSIKRKHCSLSRESSAENARNMGDVMNCLQDITKRLRKIEGRRSRSPVRKRHRRVVSSLSSSSQSSEFSLSSRSRTPPGSSIMVRWPRFKLHGFTDLFTFGWARRRPSSWCRALRRCRRNPGHT